MKATLSMSSGRYFDLLDPDNSKITIEDVAHPLSMICRFGGHTAVFYSVAQHSVYVSRLVPQEFALAGLLHDAPEAFLGDIPRPLKALLPDYKRLEAVISPALLLRFGVVELPPCVHDADLIALATERRDLMLEQAQPWPVLKGVIPEEEPLVPLSPEEAKREFLFRYAELTD